MSVDVPVYPKTLMMPVCPRCKTVLTEDGCDSPVDSECEKDHLEGKNCVCDDPIFVRYIVDPVQP